MEKANAAWEGADLPAALAAARDAARQGAYENADRRVTSLALLASIAQEAGDLTLAERSLRDAIDQIELIPGPVRQEKAILHNNLGALLDRLGDLAGAEVQYRAALALHERLPNSASQDRFSLLVNLAGLLERRNNDGEAAEFYTQAGTHAGTPLATASLNNNFAILLHRRGESVQALARLHDALGKLPAGETMPLLRASILHNLGTVEVETDQLASATGNLANAEKIRRDRLGPMHLDTAQTLASQALLRARQGDPVGALTVARESSSILARNLNMRVGWQATAAGQVRRDWREVLATHLRLLHTQMPDNTERAAEALELIQLARHGELARVFAGAMFGAGGDIGARLQAIDRQLAAFEANELALSVLLQKEGTDQTAEKQLRLLIATQRRQLETKQAEFATRHPRYVELLSGQRMSLSAIQQMLAADEVAILYLTARDETFAVAVSRERASLARLPISARTLAATIRRVRKSVEPEVADEQRFAFDEAHVLYQSLVEPLSAVLANKAVWFVIPDGPLESVPFSLFLKQPATSRNRPNWKKFAWLIRDHAPITLPSLGALALARETVRLPAAPQPLLAVADPSLGTKDETSRARAPLPGDLWQATRGRPLANPEQIKRLTPLPETADEARAIANALGGGDFLLGEQASESQLKGRDLSRYRNLLFATHGLMANQLLEFGEAALVMTPPKIASTEDDGLLSASEIAQLRLNADWVVLSACNTAASDGKPGAEGLSGLAKAFFHAGARNLLVSHWSVVSESTVLLTAGTFRHLRENPGLTRAKALQRSMLAMIDDNDSYGHPMFWAPFVLVGDGR